MRGDELVGEIPRTGDHRKDLQAATALLRAMGHEPTKLQQMFAVAAAFSTTAREVYAKHLSTAPMNPNAGVAFIVNAVLSIEIYLKTLQASVSRAQKTHSLLDLYDALPADLHALIASKADELAPRYEAAAPVDFRKALAPMSKAFERWRYVYEYSELGTVNFPPTVHVMHTLHEVARARAGL